MNGNIDNVIRYEYWPFVIEVDKSYIWSQDRTELIHNGYNAEVFFVETYIFGVLLKGTSEEVKSQVYKITKEKLREYLIKSLSSMDL